VVELFTRFRGHANIIFNIIMDNIIYFLDGLSIAAVFIKIVAGKSSLESRRGKLDIDVRCVENPSPHEPLIERTESIMYLLLLLLLLLFVPISDVYIPNRSILTRTARLPAITRQYMYLLYTY